MPTRGPPQLGSDDVVRFVDARHFLDEYVDSLAKGRVFARTRRSFDLASMLRVSVEAPEIGRSVVADARVLMSRQGFVGLEFVAFEPRIRVALERMREALLLREAETAGAPERTQVAFVRPSLLADPEEAPPPGGPIPNLEPEEGTRVEALPIAGLRREPEMAPSPPPAPQVAPPVARTPRVARPEPKPEPRAEARMDARVPPRGPERRPPAVGARAFDDEASFELVRPASESNPDEDSRPRLVPPPRPRFDPESSSEPGGLPRPAIRRPAPLPPPRAPEPRAVEARPPEPRRVPEARGPELDARTAELPAIDLRTIESARADTLPRRADPAAEARVSEPPAPTRPFAAASAEPWRSPPGSARSEPPPTRPFAASLDDEEDEDDESVEPLGPRPSLGPSAALERGPSTADLLLASAPPPHGLHARAEETEGFAAFSRDAFGGVEPPSTAPPGVAPLDPSDAAPAAGGALPPVRASGLEQLDDAPLVRATPGGVVRAAGVDVLLGLYLAGLRDGVVTLWGGPDGDTDAPVRLKLIAGRAITLEGRILARAADWVTVEVDDLTELVDLLREHEASLATLVRSALGLPAPVVAVAAAPEPEPPPRAPPAPLTPAPAPLTPPPIPLTPPPVSAAPAPPSEPVGPPEPPRIDGERLIFRSLRDLRHELETNLKSGGLSVLSGPIPLRAHRSLAVHVDAQDVGVHIEADVVFASAGRVGFAIRSTSDVLEALGRVLAGGARPSLAPAPMPTSAAPAPPGASAPPSTSQPPRSIPGPDALPPARGRLERPPSAHTLLLIQEHRPETLEPDTASSAYALLDLVARRRARGVLALRGGEQDKHLYFHEGSVVFVEARPQVEDHLLGRILVGAKKLSESALREALEKSQKIRKPLGRVLVMGGSAPQPVVVAALREQTRLKVEHALALTHGTWDWRAWSEPPTAADLVAVNGLGLSARWSKHVFEQTTAQDLEALFAPLLGRVLEPGGELALDSPILGFQPKELRFVEGWIDGKRSIADALTGSPVGRLSALRVLAFGLAIGLLRVRGGAGNVRRTPQRASTDGRGLTALKKQLLDELRLVKEQNLFEILGVHWSAHPRSFAGAYQKSRSRFDVSKIDLASASADVRQELQRLSREGLELVDAAHKKLSVDLDRIGYRRELLDATEREYGAEMLIKQGEVMLLRGDRVGGLEAFEMAFELQPNSRNRALLAQAREGRSQL